MSWDELREALANIKGEPLTDEELRRVRYLLTEWSRIAPAISLLLAAYRARYIIVGGTIAGVMMGVSTGRWEVLLDMLGGLMK